ncbi:MAG: hypothetical protein ACR2KV_05665 [Solirubrobacteraceae bacterium]
MGGSSSTSTAEIPLPTAISAVPLAPNGAAAPAARRRQLVGRVRLRRRGFGGVLGWVALTLGGRRILAGLRGGRFFVDLGRPEPTRGVRVVATAPRHPTPIG